MTAPYLLLFRERHKMKKLAKLFAFLAITGMMTACGESPVGVSSVGVLEIASEIDCEEGDPSPATLVCE